MAILKPRRASPQSALNVVRGSTRAARAAGIQDALTQTYMHEGKQYIVVQIGSVQTDYPGALVAYTLP